ncbi:MAG TPA: hypothetical protein DEB31_01495 [Clostridiales bacterium]|nr:hypothetical protein [Clostridiales bacterium]
MAKVEKKAMQSGIEPIEDEQLADVAGGNRIFANDEEEAQAKEQAAADGRNYMLPPMNFICVCSHKYKFSRTKEMSYLTKHMTCDVYWDIKCYKCGKTWGYKKL